MKKLKVMCTFFVEVTLTDEQYERRHFIIEDNGCPGTGLVGVEVERAIEKGTETGICWACTLSGENRIVFDEQVECRHVEMKS